MVKWNYIRYTYIKKQLVQKELTLLYLKWLLTIKKMQICIDFIKCFQVVKRRDFTMNNIVIE